MNAFHRVFAVSDSTLFFIVLSVGEMAIVWLYWAEMGNLRSNPSKYIADLGNMQ